ncbi:translational repressor Pumilio/PUF3 and related RNA-binding protein [Scheffersomyces amazonensis]|uniref:translational repressor Pumilio/PUF3 and related RNA-binding protein n=1 Tax=Scheffersomyces amazonensis TaxID=1078765 RepID=UPI00315D1F77
MPSETIWSSGGNTSPIQSHGVSQYRSVLDSVDPEVAKLLSTTSSSTPANDNDRRFSFNDGSDIDGSIFGLKKGTFSAITAPVGGTGNGPNSANLVNNSSTTNPRLNFGTASISGGIASRHPHPQDSFLQKFASVADATREIELSNGFTKLNLDNSNSRRTSFNTNNPVSNDSPIILSSPHGSMNENLNMPAPRNSRHQSISEKIDQYNNTSPIQASAALSVNSDLNSIPNDNLNLNHSLSNNGPNSKIPNGGNGNQNHMPHNFWNPATASSFTPAASSYQYFMDGIPEGVHVPPPQVFNPYGGAGIRNPLNGNNSNIPPITPPPFMLSSPPPQFMDPALFNLMNYGPINSTNNPTNLSKNDSESGENNSERDSEASNSANTETNSNSQTTKGTPKSKNNIITPGIGMMNRQLPPASFMFHPYNPYSVYHQSPPPIGIPPLSPNPLPLDGNLAPQGFIDPSIVPPPQQSQSQQSQSQQQQQQQQPGNGDFPPLAPIQQAPSTKTPPNSNGGGKRKNGGSKSGNSNTNGNNNGNGKGGANHIYRSPLLEEVRSNSKGKEYYLKDIYGHAVEFTKDQHGSRFIQQKLPDATDEEKEVIFNEIRDISYELMTDVFGNYVIQKYFEFGSMTQKKVLLDYMLGHIYELSLQMYGCRVVQRALEAIELDGQIKIIEELKDFILICAKDQNGNHVIQKSIERIPFNKIRFVLESLENQIYHLSTHPYGCRVIQRLLEFSDIKDQEVILKELNRFIFYLIQDQYGNYVMQHILEHGELRDREEILKVVLGAVVNFSKHKFASNVIEKCIKFGTLDQRRRILHEVMLGNEDFTIELVDDDSPLALMMKDQYANYVIQKLVEGFDAKSEEKKVLVVKLRQYLKQISSRNTYGKHLASVEKMIIVAETALDEADNN